MKFRVLFSGVLTVVCLVALWNVFAQRRELVSLRADQQRLQTESAPTNDSPGSSATADMRTAVLAVPRADSSSMRELLRLRAEVTKLADRQRELAGVRGENERLHAQVAARATNAPAAGGLPPGYIMRSKAQWAGLNTPEDSLQSFLWAVQNRDFANLLSVLTPESAQRFQAQVREAGNSTDAFFQDVGQLPGLRVASRQTQPDGSIELRVEIVPGQPNEAVRFEQIGGQWKMAF
jgi:hypothetical protein